eukprot:Rhum_TRINITY_DN13066_c0_g1::Rhum_TRINITY_DN13066_c0_g1_i1::g.56636::m.56636
MCMWCSTHPSTVRTSTLRIAARRRSYAASTCAACAAAHGAVTSPSTGHTTLAASCCCCDSSRNIFCDDPRSRTSPVSTQRPSASRANARPSSASTAADEGRGRGSAAAPDAAEARWRRAASSLSKACGRSVAQTPSHSMLSRIARTAGIRYCAGVDSESDGAFSSTHAAAPPAKHAAYASAMRPPLPCPHRRTGVSTMLLPTGGHQPRASTKPRNSPTSSMSLYGRYSGRCCVWPHPGGSTATTSQPRAASCRPSTAKEAALSRASGMQRMRRCAAASAVGRHRRYAWDKSPHTVSLPSSVSPILFSLFQ